MRIMVLGAAGMLGSALQKEFCHGNHQVTGVVRGNAPGDLPGDVISGTDVLDEDALIAAFTRAKPDVVVNAVGLVKQRHAASDVRSALQINAMLPHRLADLCQLANSRLILVSTDCVYSGAKGNYRESDKPDPVDVYGMSKLLGEISDRPNVLTLRTSIIGHETRGSRQGLVEWFLNAPERVDGYSNAIFSGFPTVVLARLIAEQLLDRNDLSGLYHISADPINKWELLTLIADIYGQQRVIEPRAEPHIDRSLNSDRLRNEIGYQPPSWPDLVRAMREEFQAQEASQ